MQEEVKQITHESIDKAIDECYNSTRKSNSISNFCIRYRYNLLYLSLGVANSSDASEILCLSYVLSEPSFENSLLEKDYAYRGSIVAGSVFFGMLLGGIIVGSLGDLAFFGRKSILLLGLSMNAIFGILASCSGSFQQFIFFRGMAGVGIGGSVPPLFTLAAELAPSSQRGYYVTLVASFWMIGSIFIAFLALIVLEYWGYSWRVFMMLSAIPASCGVFCVACFVPESPRFYCLTDRQSLAFKNLIRVLNSINPLHENILDFSITDGILHATTHSTSSTTSSSSSSYGTIKQSFQNIKRLYSQNTLYFMTTISLQIIWACLSFGSYGLTTWINTIFVSIHLQNVYFLSFLFALANLPGNILSAILLDRIGRHDLLLISMIIASISLVIFAYYANKNSSDNSNQEYFVSPSTTIMIVICACTFQALSITAWNTIDTMSSEMFPTSLRTTGLALCTASGRIGAMVAQFVNGVMVNYNLDGLLLVVSSLMLLGGALVPKILMRNLDTHNATFDMTGKALMEEDDFTSSNNVSNADDSAYFMESTNLINTTEQDNTQNKSSTEYNHQFS